MDPWVESLIQRFFKPKDVANAAIYEWDSLENEEETYVLAIDPLQNFLYDMEKERGWELVENVPLKTGKIIYKAAEYLRGGENSIPGNVLRVRARRMWGCGGQKHAELLLAFQRKIPKTLREFCWLFPGTIWREPESGILRIPVLCREKPLNTKDRWAKTFDLIDPEMPRLNIVLEKKWQLGFCPIGSDFEWGPLGRFDLLRGPACSIDTD